MEGAVLTRYALSDGGFGSSWEHEALCGVGDGLNKLLAEGEVGEFDGHDVGGGQFTLYLYGPDPDALLAAVRPILLRHPWPQPPVVVKRYGPPGSPEVRVTLDRADSDG